MSTETTTFSLHQISALLGVNTASIDCWVDSGKLKCTFTLEGEKHFTTEQLSSFALEYNISMKFLDGEKRVSFGSNNFSQISAAK